MPTVHIVFGSQGAGKTTYSRLLADKENAIRFSIDEWMIELFGADLPKPMSFPWVMARVQRCEKRIWSVASELVQRGGSVVLDLGFMKIGDRKRFIALCEEKELTVQRHFVIAAHGIRRSRVISRNSDRGETFAFDVSPAVFDFMETQFESPTDSEISECVTYSTD
jgi:predicted kinase